MRFPHSVLSQLELRFQVLLPQLNERHRRLVPAQEERLLGHGGVRVDGVSVTTVPSGAFELESGGDPLPAGRVRVLGGGAPRIRTRTWCRHCWGW
jgi:hypothetical protein